MTARLALLTLALAACATDVDGCSFTHPAGHFGGANDTIASYNLATSTLPSGVTCSRTGTAAAYPARSASTYVSTAATTCIYEDRGDNTPGGWWAFDGYQNRVASPLGLGGAGWSDLNTTRTAAAAVACPDGTTGNAYKVATVTPGSITVAYHPYTTSTDDGVVCAWVRDDATATPTYPLVGMTPGLSNATYTLNDAGSGSTWRRRCSVVEAYGYAASYVQLWLSPSTSTGNVAVGAAGALNVCGSSLVTGEVATSSAQIVAKSDVPMIDGTTGDQVLSLSTPGQVVQSGDLDVEISFVPGVWSAPQWQAGPGDGSIGAYFFGGSSTDGEMSLRLNNVSGGQVILKVRGTDVLTAMGSNTVVAFANAVGARTATGTSPQTYIDTGNIPQEVTVRAWYRPSTGASGIRIGVNGAYQADTTGTTTGGALVAPTTFYALSKNGASEYFPGRVTGVKVYKSTASNAPITAYGVSLGDSLTRSNPRYVSVPSFFYNANEARSRNKKIAILALGGDTCEGQLGVLQASSYHDNNAVRWFTDQCGINNIGAGDSAATLITKIQANVDYIKLHNPSAKIIRGCISPAWGYWNTTYGGAAADARETIRQAVNTAIQGGGGTPITGVDAVVCGYNATLTAGDGKSLKTQYDVGTGVGGPDGIHYSDEARATVVAPAYRTAIDGLGL
jgi:hypothetical protein